MSTAAPVSPPLPRASFCLDLLVEICRHISADGLSEAKAALRAGVHPETLRRWRRAHPELPSILAAARESRPAASSIDPARPLGPEPSADRFPVAGSPPPSPTTPVTRRRRGRPSAYSHDLAATICALVRLHGWSDSRAGLHLGYPCNVIGYWKRVHPEFAAQLNASRADFVRARNASRPRLVFGDWQSHAEALTRAFPSAYSSRRRSINRH